MVAGPGVLVRWNVTWDALAVAARTSNAPAFVLDINGSDVANPSASVFTVAVLLPLNVALAPLAAVTVVKVTGAFATGLCNESVTATFNGLEKPVPTPDD